MPDSDRSQEFDHQIARGPSPTITGMAARSSTSFVSDVTEESVSAAGARIMACLEAVDDASPSASSQAWALERYSVVSRGTRDSATKGRATSRLTISADVRDCFRAFDSGAKGA